MVGWRGSKILDIYIFPNIWGCRARALGGVGYRCVSTHHPSPPWASLSQHSTISYKHKLLFTSQLKLSIVLCDCSWMPRSAFLLNLLGHLSQAKGRASEWTYCTCRTRSCRDFSPWTKSQINFLILKIFEKKHFRLVVCCVLAYPKKVNSFRETNIFNYKNIFFRQVQYPCN